MNWIQKQTLSRKIYLIMVLTIITVSIVFYSGLSVLVRRYDETMYHLAAVGLHYAIEELDRKIDEIASVTDEMALNTQIQEDMRQLLKDTEGQGNVRADAYNACYPYFVKNSSIRSLTLFHRNAIINMGYGIELSDQEREQLLTALADKNGDAIWFMDPQEPENIVCMRMIRQRKYRKFTDVGAVYLVANFQAVIAEAIAGMEQLQNGTLIVLDQEQNVIGGEITVDEEQLQKLTKQVKSESPYRIEQISGLGRKFLISGKLKIDGWNYIYMMDYEGLFQHLSTVRFFVVVVSLFAAMFCLVLVKKSYARIFMHLELLVRKLRDYGAGKEISSEPEPIYRERKDEIGELHRAFHQMTCDVRRLRDENYEKQMLLKDTTIKMLRQQINPHFLYNTLDTINWMAIRDGKREISKMVQALAVLYRAAVGNKEETVELKDELHYLESYILIQRVRYKDRLDFCVCCDETLKTSQVPKLCIQPLVENAIKYSLECNEEICVIRVEIEKKKENLMIRVSNTGSIFEADVMNRLKSGELKSQGSGIGLLNIEQRLKLIYGEGCGLSIWNEDGMAVVSLQLPYDSQDGGKE